MRGRRFWCIGFCILLFDLFSLSSEEKAIPVLPLPDQLLFIPSTYFVGDRVTLRFSLDTSSIEEELHPPRMVPSLSWGVVHQIQLIPFKGKKGYEVHISFTPYKTGRQIFPYLELGPLRLEQIPVQVSSLLQTAREVPQPIRDQAMIPYLNVLLLLGIGIFLATPLIYLLWKRGLHAVLVLSWDRYRGKRLYRQLLRKLDHLEHRISTMEPNIFYSSLQENLRSYLSHRWNPKIIAYTTTEIGKLLGVNHPGSGLLEVFQRGDKVRFAGMEVNTHVLRSDLLAVRQGVDEVERTFWQQGRKVKG